MSGEDFSKFKVDEFKSYLRERGIQLSDGGKAKRKAELLDLCEKAAAMKQRKLDDSAEDRNKLMEEKFKSSEGLDKQVFEYSRVYFRGPL